MRREGILVAVALLAAGGCANVLDLQSRELEQGSGTPNSFDDGGNSSSSGASGSTASSSGSASSASSSGSSTSSSSGSASSASSSSSGAAFTPCTSATIIYEHTKGSGEETAYRYTDSDAPVADFGGGTAVFRAMISSDSKASLAMFTLRSPDGSDFMVATQTVESDYTAINSAFAFGYPIDYPGTIQIWRWVHDKAVPTRHKLMTTKVPTGNWNSEPNTWHVCPLE